MQPTWTPRASGSPACRTPPHPEGGGRSPRCRCAPLVLAALGAAAILAGRPVAAAGQVGSALVGATGGLAAGLYTTTAIYVTEARFGHYIYSPDEVLTLNPRLLPVVAGTVAGGWLGAESGHALGRAGLWGGVGLLGGATLGLGVGHLVWDTSEGRWAGAVMGSALGLLAGAVLGGREGLGDDDDDDDGAAAMTFAVSIPVGGSG